ncbi:MAG: lipoprotein [Paludibacteraceae bacterium]|nr:lipoprotein [Paludibacteraceae bacterium]MBQ9672607.1 lipoprotein [Prevotella sp.]
MKKIFYFAVLTIMLAACGQSQEQKADTLIKEI